MQIGQQIRNCERCGKETWCEVSYFKDDVSGVNIQALCKHCLSLDPYSFNQIQIARQLENKESQQN